MAPGHKKVDVAIVGGGPAGAAAALVLARAGHRVLLVERQTAAAFKFGEGLPPAAKPLLRALGVWDRFCADGHLASYGNQSAWGSPHLHSTDFIRDPNGHGWHLDRPRFDALLRGAAQAAGAHVCTETAIKDHARSAGGWRMTLVTAGAATAVDAAWLLDCSGRASWLARTQGARRIPYDRLVASGALFHPPPAAPARDDDSLTLIEAAPAGWWYTARLPAAQRVVVFLSDAGSAAARTAAGADGFLQLLAATAHITARLDAHGYTMAAAPRVVSANSARLDRFGGEGWLAAGDAAAAFDPLSSQGILTALYSGLKAGEALHAHLAGEREAVARYEQRMAAIFDAYLQNRTLYYSYEQRWPEHEFWRAR
jgi:2-polyprenyl-6-methoxyphenol hydroxylase-like FAD-dependent oxidoreductase